MAVSKITKTSILDVFNQVVNEKEAAKPDLCINLLKHITSYSGENSEVDEHNVPMEIKHAIQRLIRGLGSSRAPVRKNYFATLVSLLGKSGSTFGSISLSYFKNLVEKQLSKFESKGEEGEVLSGRILAYGVALRSQIFMNGSVELQQEIISEMLTKSKERSYLPLLVYTFIVDFINSLDENMFKTVIWPILVEEVMVQWSSQSFETLYCLLEVQNKYPSILKKKLILTTLGTSSILHQETIENVQKMLINITWEPCLQHPLYDSISRTLCESENNFELLDKFWEHIEEVMSNSPSRLKILAVLTIFGALMKYVKTEKIPDLLTSSLVENIINACRSSVSKTDELSVLGKRTLQLIITRVTEKVESGIPNVIYKVLNKLVFESGQILIDKITGIKVVIPCVSKLDTKHVKLLAKKCENVVLLKSQKNDKAGTQHRRNFKDRCYATQLLARLISHPQSQDMDWKIKHLKLLMKYALFTPKIEEDAQVSGELAIVLKNSFFTALSHQLSHLENHRMVLISLVFYINNILTTDEYELRTKLSDEVLASWKDTMLKINKIDIKINESAKKKTVMPVFHTLFLQMALHLFVDPTTALNILKELDRCYEKQKCQLNKHGQDENDDEAEPKWIEIAVELFLSLLSHDTYLLRQLISRIFPHLCPHLTAQATFQILQVFDPSSNENILTEENADSEGESIDEEENEIEDDQVQNSAHEANSGEESDSEIEDIDDMEETAIERTRQAIRDALGMAGSVTDTESIDLDDIDEEDGRKLDVALSQAFKNVQRSQNKNKKQSASDKALTNFRIRVLDLVDIYLDNNPSLSLVLDTIPVLFKLLEFTIKDSHQKPLEIRTRSTIKKIGHLKKCSNVEEVDEELLIVVLKSLMDKGVRSTPVFLGLCNEMSECCTFLLRMHIQSGNDSTLLYSTFVTYIENFFSKRDCLLPISLFENILFKTNWNMNPKLCERIVKFSFDVSVRGFRRNQGLSLLCGFYRNTRLLSGLRETNSKELRSLEDEILESATKVLKPKNEAHANVKATFISELFLLLCTMKNNKFSDRNSKWQDLSNTVQSFLSNGASSTNISRKYVVKLCSVLHLSHTVKRNELSRKMKNAEKICDDTPATLNGFMKKNSSNVDIPGENNEDSELEMNGDSVLSSKNVIKKKKSKRKHKKTKEQVNAKRLRGEIANDVEVLTFSGMKLSESF